MTKLILGAFLLCAYGCSSDDSANAVNGGASSVGGGASSGAGSHAGGKGNVAGAGSVADAGARADVNAGAGGAEFAGAGPNEGGAAGSDAPGAAGEGGSQSPSTCSAAHATLLGAIDTVSTGDVSVVSNTMGVATFYVGATAGGTAAAAMNPWIFVSLDSSSKVAVTDVSSTTSTAWDLAFKRPLLYTNSGDGGPGVGGAVLIDEDFDAVTAADAATVTFAKEKFFDAQCDAILDPTGAALTTFATWYDYDANTHVLSPRAGTWLVHGATGKLFKLRINTYYGTSTGGAGMAGGAYLIEVGAL